MGINYIVADSKVYQTEDIVGEGVIYHLDDHDVVTPKNQFTIGGMPDLPAIDLKDGSGRDVARCVCRRAYGNWIGERVRLEEIKDYSGKVIARWTDKYSVK